MKKTLLTTLATGFFMIGMAGVANATYTGYLYDSVSANSGTAQSVLQAFETSSGTNQTVDATFTVQNINFDTQRIFSPGPPIVYQKNTYTQFFQGGTVDINGLTPLTGAVWGNFISTDGSTTALVKIDGNAYFNSSFSITHDDGAMIVVGGKLFDASAPTTPTTSTFTLASQGLSAGWYHFDLYYEAWNGNPEVLTTSGINPVPEPATMLLFGTGLAGLAGFARRKRS